MKSFYCICVSLFFFAPAALWGQCSGAAQNQIDKGISFKFNDRDKAIEWLEKGLSKCPKSEEGYFHLADIYREKKQYKDEHRVLESYLQHVKSVDPRVYCFVAEAEKKVFLFDEAAAHYQKYLDLKTSNRELNYRANKSLADVLFAKESYQNAPEISFTALNDQINTGYSEYLPIMTADERFMIFTRRFHVGEEAWYAEKGDSNRWREPKPVSVLPADKRRAGVSMSVDGDMLVFAMTDDPAGFGNFDLYIIERKDGSWSRPKNLGSAVNSSGWDSQPCISADGRTIFFSSDRKGGEGGHDIWKTVRDGKGRWQIPTNLGSEVNSPGHEESPFIHRDQRTLYFRSEGHPGLGSFDIFMSRMIRFQKWTEPVNLGYPINTIGNDGSLFVTLDGTQAYIASDVLHENMTDHTSQVEMEHIDIYEFALEEKFRPIPTTYVQLIFENKDDGQRLIPYVELLDFNSGDTLYFGNSDETGEVLLCLPRHSEYALSVELHGFVTHFERFEPADRSWGAAPVLKTIQMQPVYHREDLEVQAEPVRLSNVLFQHDSEKLLSGSYASLEKLYSFLSENPDLKIEIRGHTDNSGTPQYNVDLSGRRAKSVMNYLIQKGIPSDRLSWKGFGETMPLSDNDTEEGRRMNRRTEFLILGSD